MIFKKLTIFFLPVLFYSCASLSINKRVEVNESEDWLFIGGDPPKSNISKSKSSLNPPFNLYWQFDVDGGLAKNSLSASDAILFANTLNGEFFTIDITTGKSLGRTSALGKASYSTPVVFNNNIIITSSGDKDSRIFSYDLNKGTIQWQKNIGWVESSPVMIGEDVIVSSLNGKIYKINAGSGKIIWTTKPSERKISGISFYTSPSVYGNLVLAGNIDGNMYAFDLITGKEVWKFKTGASVFSDASIKEGKIYFGSDDKNFYCVDTAGSLVWKKNLNTKFLSSPTFYNQMVIISGVDGNIYSMEMNTGNVKWTFATKGSICASPLLANNKIFIGSYDRNFYCISAEDGHQLWMHECEGRVKTSAVVWKDYIFVGTDEKYIYCFSNQEYPKNSSGKSLN